jgi:hypothetical protein
MKSFLFAFIFSLALAPSSFADDDDPEYKDDAIWRVHAVLAMPGSVQIDRLAQRTGANEWDIRVQNLTDLQGSTAQEVEASWQEHLRDARREILKNLRKKYGSLVPKDIRDLTPETAAQIGRALDIRVALHEGLDDKLTREWIVREILTRPARGQLETHFLGSDADRKKFEYFHFKKNDTSSEVIGEDILLIRGFRKVITVRISYVHS